MDAVLSREVAKKRPLMLQHNTSKSLKLVELFVFFSPFRAIV